MENIDTVEVTWGKPLRGASSILQADPRSLFKKRLHDFGIGDAAEDLHRLTNRLWRRITTLSNTQLFLGQRDSAKYPEAAQIIRQIDADIAHVFRAYADDFAKITKTRNRIEKLSRDLQDLCESLQDIDDDIERIEERIVRQTNAMDDRAAKQPGT